MRELRRWWLAVSIHFFGAYVSLFALLSQPYVRQLWLWDRQEWLCTAAALALSAAGAVAAAVLLERALPAERRAPALDRLFALYAAAATGFVFWNASLSGPFPRLVEALPRWAGISTLSWVEGSAKTGLLLLAAWAWLRRPRRLAGALAAFFLVLSPTVIVFFLQAAAFRSVRADAGELSAPSRPPEAAGSVYFFVFDMWTYERAFAGGRPRPGLPALEEYSKRAVVLHRAFSPRTNTLESIPRMLTLKPLGRVSWDYMASDRDMGALLDENLFAAARAAGFRTFAVGVHIPYADWFGRWVDYAFSVSHYKPVGMGPGLGVLHALWALQKDNLLLRVSGLSERLDTRYALWRSRGRLESVHARTLEVLEKSGRGAFAFFHYPIPHHIAGEAPTDPGASEEFSAAMRARMDRVLSDVLGTLRRTGRWEDSLIVLASDHAEQTGPYPHCHVPAFILVPGRKGHADSYVAFDLRRLRGLFLRAFAGKGDAAALRSDPELRRLLAGGMDPVSTCERLPYPPL